MLWLQHTDLQRTLHELQSEIRSLSDQQVSVYSVSVKPYSSNDETTAEVNQCMAVRKVRLVEL